MTQKEQRMYYQALFNRKERGIDTDALEEILRLNRRAVSAWERQNSYDRFEQAYYDKQDCIQTNAWNKAESICFEHGWKLESSGLWWAVIFENYDIALPVF